MTVSKVLINLFAAAVYLAVGVIFTYALLGSP